MKNIAKIFLLIVLLSCRPGLFAQVVIHVNQVALDAGSPKIAIIENRQAVSGTVLCDVVNVKTGATTFRDELTDAGMIAEWRPGLHYYRFDFSQVKDDGNYELRINLNGVESKSDQFYIGRDALARLTIPSILHYYRKQRANTPAELKADSTVQLWGSDKKVDMRGGWCDASGDVSKYFSHLAYANFMSPQQTPLVTWSLVRVAEAVPQLLTELSVKDSIVDEALWGADYMMRALSDQDYFHMIIFSYFNKDPNARRVVGLLANSVTTADYQCAFREGGGMAIAALARISQWKKDGAFSSAQYLDGAQRAFAHLLINNRRYDDDGKENIIDDYCALMAATELWIATNDGLYRFEARRRANHLNQRMSDRGYFISDDGSRPFWHASDAGLPIVALVRYLDKETDTSLRRATLKVISRALSYNLSVTNNVSNPFGYARQSFRFGNIIKDGFFIPHENETGWWWQGEDARLASLATAALVGGKLIHAGDTPMPSEDSLAVFASQQLSWILGCNPFSVCMMYQFGKNNVPYMRSNFGHGSEKGGISNGITGKDGNPDGSGIDFKINAEGNEWRWTEQWIPHAAWFLQAVAAMAEAKDK